VIVRSSSVDADRRPTLPKWTALAAAKSGGGTPRVDTSGRLDIKHRQRLAAFISAPFLHFRTPFCEPAAPGTPALQLELQKRGEPRLAHSTEMRLLGAQALRRGRRRISSGPFALIAPPNSAKPGPDLYESKDASSDLTNNVDQR
jgi:hypothetical protein